MVRTVEERVDMGPMLCEQTSDVAVDVFDVAGAIEPTCDPGLVGHDRHRYSGPIQPGDRLRGAVDELDPVNGPDIAVIDNDRPVPVEQDAWAGNRVALPSPASSTRRGGRRVLTSPERGADQACSCQFGQLRHVV